MMRLGGFIALCIGALGCQPGYIKASELEAQGQGPSACRKSCEDIGMRMTALVLVGNSLPGCVCQPLTRREPLPGPAPAPASSAGPAEEGAAASTTGYIVVAAAAAAARQQQLQIEQQQRHQK